MFEKIPLQGLELDQYKWEREKKRQEEEQHAQADSDSDSDSEDESGESGESGDTDPPPLPKNTPSRKVKSAKSYPMYPYSDTRSRWDDYGEMIDPEDFTLFDQSKKALARDDEFARAQGGGEEGGGGEGDRVAGEETVPMKTVSDVKTLNIACDITYIDFEGRSDGESVKKMIAMMKPRRVIAVHGSLAAVSSLASYCDTIKSDVAFIEKVFTPKVGQIVDATTESNIYQVRCHFFFAIMEQLPKLPLL